MKKIFNVIKSMTTAVVLLVLVGLASVAGTILPQNEEASFYVEKYGMGKANLIQRLSLNQVFTSTWYLIIVGLLCLSILTCVVFRTKPIVIAFKKGKKRRAFTLLGSWMLHISIVIISIFFTLGNIYAFDTTVYNIKDTVTPVKGTGLLLAIDDFNVDLRKDKSVESYVSDVRIYDGGGSLKKKGEIRVNQPMNVDGYQFSQASFGYTSQATVSRNGEKIGTATLFQKEVVSADSGKFIIEMIDLYPDYYEEGGEMGTKSQDMNNPHAYVNLYYMDALVDTLALPMNEKVEVGEFTVELSEPSYYTLLAVRKDPYAIFVGLGAIMLVLGIFMVFFIPDEKRDNTDIDQVEEEIYG